MQLIDNDFIVKLFFSFQTAERLYMVMEFMQGGELFFHLKQQRKFNESRAKLYACEIIVALEHLHKNQIIYRDLKPENILLDIHGHLKLTDFGLSKMILDEEDEELELPNLNEKYNNKQSANKLKAFTICGTPEYLCPEILSGKGYDKTVDWWSLGVLIYEMIAGYSPFKNINKNKLDLSSYFKPIKYKNFSEDAESLISGLLQTDYTKRLGYGANARAALVTRGLAEMMRLGLAMSAKSETFTGLTGLGDLVLTCTDDKSRNRRFGLALGRGESLKDAEKNIGQVVEGIVTAKHVHTLATKLNVDMPITEQVYRLLQEQCSPQQAVFELLNRRLKSESGF